VAAGPRKTAERTAAVAAVAATGVGEVVAVKEGDIGGNEGGGSGGGGRRALDVRGIRVRKGLCALPAGLDHIVEITAIAVTAAIAATDTIDTTVAIVSREEEETGGVRGGGRVRGRGSGWGGGQMG
jgi:hypothetical protein